MDAHSRKLGLEDFVSTVLNDLLGRFSLSDENYFCKKNIFVIYLSINNFNKTLPHTLLLSFNKKASSLYPEPLRGIYDLGQFFRPLNCIFLCKKLK